MFWALRGGGGNFGIVTAFEFQLHELGQQVISGLVVDPFADAEVVLEQYRQALEGAPDELTCWAVMRQAPSLPFLPPEWHGKKVLVLAMCFCGDIEAGEKATAKLRSIGKPIADVVGPRVALEVSVSALQWNLVYRNGCCCSPVGDCRFPVIPESALVEM